MICRDNTSYMFHLWRWHFRHGNWIDRLRIVAFNIECFSFSQKFEKSLDYLLYPKPLSHSSSFLGFLQHNTAESLSRSVSSLLMDIIPMVPRLSGYRASLHHCIQLLSFHHDRVVDGCYFMFIVFPNFGKADERF